MNKIQERVVVQKISEIQEDLNSALEVLGDFVINDEDIIVIKPNLCDFRPPWEGGTTDPRIVEALIYNIRKKANPKIVIVESNHAIADADVEFERMGYSELAKNLNVELVNLSNDKIYDVALGGYYFSTLEAPETLLKATKFISVAKLKTHAQQKITCNLKNYFGLLPGKVKSPFHPFMSEVLADLIEFYKPSLCIIDGIVGMEGFGPSDGTKIERGIILVGKNAIAVDAIAAKIMGFNPKKIPNLKYSSKKNLGPLTDIEIISNYNIQESEPFHFIPLYSYFAYRAGFMLQRFTIKFSQILKNLYIFISQTSVGYLIIKEGFIFIPEYGMLMRKDLKRYLKGLFLRPAIQINLLLKLK